MKPVVANVDVNLNGIVTPKSCSLLVCELIKNLVYQREQIPYTYDRLRYLITKRQELLSKQLEENEEQQISMHSRIAVDRHYVKAEETFANLEHVLQIVQSELETSSPSGIEQVALIFGATPLHPQNIFNIQIPALEFGHNEDSHPSRKHLPTLFQSIVSSDALNKMFSKKLSPTNIFVLLKMKAALHPTSEMFLKKDNYDIPFRNSQINFTFRNSSQNGCSCYNESKFPVFYDTPSRHCSIDSNVMQTQSTKEVSLLQEDISECDDFDSSWFQFNGTIKGFKDMKIEGTSVANLWLKHTASYNLTS